MKLVTILGLSWDIIKSSVILLDYILVDSYADADHGQTSANYVLVFIAFDKNDYFSAPAR
jgi:hypothetical protein